MSAKEARSTWANPAVTASSSCACKGRRPRGNATSTLAAKSRHTEKGQVGDGCCTGGIRGWWGGDGLSEGGGRGGSRALRLRRQAGPCFLTGHWGCCCCCCCCY